MLGFKPPGTSFLAPHLYDQHGLAASRDYDVDDAIER
jgi:hypothetical protein